MKKAVVIALLLTGAGAPTAWADRAADEAACRTDVRKFCHKLQSNAGDDAFLACLQQNRAKLTPKCLKVLTDNGV